MPDRFLEQDFRVLTPEAFEFVLNNELKRAVRSQNYLTLVVVEAMLRGATADAEGDRDQALSAVAKLVSREVRETDLIARTDQGQLSVVLLDADLQNSMRVIDRLLARLNHYEFPRPLAFDVGAACCPTHGADVESLKRAAEVRPVRQRGNHSTAQ
jgi:diguanylate cyclase (GGDEF)-like protein